MIRRISSHMRCTSNSLNVAPAIGMPADVTPCSGRGDCLNGTCFCDIRYSGDECTGFNVPYHAGNWYGICTHIYNICGHNTDLFLFLFSMQIAGLSSVFYFVAALSIVQLLICCVAEYQRLKRPSLIRAFRLTTQKLLYFVVFVAALLRGAYFTTPVCIHTAQCTYSYVAFESLECPAKITVH